MRTMTLGFVGLGHMGEPMARNLLAAGFAVRVFNRTPSRAEALAREGAIAVTRLTDVASRGGTVVTMLANDAALEQVTLGEGGLLDALGDGGLHISMSTVSPQTSRRLAQAHARAGSLFLAAPVFGRPEAAAARKLWICQSGSAEARARARPVLEALSQGIHDFGDDPGAASVVKLSGNFLILSAIEALAEAFAMAEKSGVERSSLATFLGQTLFACPIYQNYGRIVASRAYEPAGFRLALGMKDVRLVQEAAESVQAPMPMASLLHDRLLSGLAKGRAELDWTAIELSVAEDAGIPLSR